MTDWSVIPSFLSDKPRYSETVLFRLFYLLLLLFFGGAGRVLFLIPVMHVVLLSELKGQHLLKLICISNDNIHLIDDSVSNRTGRGAADAVIQG